MVAAGVTAIKKEVETFIPGLTSFYKYLKVYFHVDNMYVLKKLKVRREFY